MDRKIILLGDMGDKFGTEWHGSVDTIIDAFKLIDCQTEGFKKYILEALDNGLDAAIMLGSEIIDDSIQLGKISSEDIVMCLIPAGSGKGWGKILAAIAIVVFTIFVPVGPALSTVLYSLATNLALAGVAELLAKTPDTPGAEEDGTVFNGPSNTLKQGQPLPLLYGQLLVGGSPVSVDFSAGTREGIEAIVNTNYGPSKLSGGGAVNATTADTTGELRRSIVTDNSGGSGGRITEYAKTKREQ